MKVKDITNSLQEWAPLPLQESYDNSGLLVGDKNAEVSSCLITLDVTEEVIDEAIQSGSNLIIAHHPLIFSGIKKLTNDHWVNRCIIKAIKHDIAIYAIHTNLDNIHTGVNNKIADKLELTNRKILRPKSGTLSKIVTFIPEENTEEVLNELFNAGAGNIGEYENCSFRILGTGTFKGSEKTTPALGAKEVNETVSENRVEIICPQHAVGLAISRLKNAHPYEEVAYYLQNIENKDSQIGSGMIGSLTSPMNNDEFVSFLKSQMNLDIIKCTDFAKDKVSRVALCGGSGSFLLQDAIRGNADVFITGDLKHHDYFEADNQITVMDIGHYESEVFTKDLIGNYLQEKFTNIAVRLSEVNTNPIIYI